MFPNSPSTDARHPWGTGRERDLEELCRLVRYHILQTTTRAGSGHPTSSLSATDLMTALLFDGIFRFDLNEPQAPTNDRLVFSKGHASPLLYALLLAAGHLSETELLSYRKFNSPLEGHPTPAIGLVDAATGSLGQGLSIGLGMALNAKYIDQLPYRTFVLLGDGEMTEGSQWEALELAAHYGLDNLVGVLDVNRLGQTGATILGHDCAAYERRVRAFGWEAISVDGHDLGQIRSAYHKARATTGKPTMVIAKTIKGKGVSFLENEEHWHGKALDREQLRRALVELGDVRRDLRGEIKPPKRRPPHFDRPMDAEVNEYEVGSSVATRTAYGRALARVASRIPHVVGLDGEVSNSTKAQLLAQQHEGRFFEMYIAEQNMVGTAVGLAQRGKIPFVSTFAAFLTRAFDQIRMAAYSNANIKFVGSHAGVSIGEDGPSQMGLEDIAMFRAVLDSVVLHPCDATATDRLVEVMAQHDNMVYLRTMRQKTPVIYDSDERFVVGGSKVLRSCQDDCACIVAAGATVHEALSAYDALANEGIFVRVIDAYSIKPLDENTLRRAAEQTGRIVTVEDHYAQGGLGEAVLSALADSPAVVKPLAVRIRPRSGKPEELLDYEGISARAIANEVRRFKRAS